MPTYPGAIDDILPGNQSFLVIAPAGTAGGAPGGVRVDHMGGRVDLSTMASPYASSASSWTFRIANKYDIKAGEFRVAEEDASFQALVASGTYVDVYIKRSNNSLTYDSIETTMMTVYSKEIPEDGTNHRVLLLTFEGGIFTENVAAGSVPSYA